MCSRSVSSVTQSFPTQWCYPTISSSVVHFPCLQSFPESVSSPMSQLFTSGGQSIGVSASASVLPVNTQDWFSLGWTGWISLMSKHHFRIVLGKDSASICWAFTFTYENKEKNGWNWSKSEEINSLSSPNYWNIKIFFIKNFDSSKFIKLIRHNQLFCNFQKPILFFYFLFFSFIFISWRLITLQYCSGFCHTLTWISHGFTCVPHSDPPSHPSPHPIPLGLLSELAPSTCIMHPTWAGDLFHPW